MSFGIRIYDEHGLTIIDENTYTVRAVNSLIVNIGYMGQGARHRVYVAGARAGMFAIVSPLWQYYRVWKDFPKGYNQFNGMRYDLEGHDNTPCLPSVEVYDGYIDVVASSIPYSVTYAYVAIYIFTNR